MFSYLTSWFNADSDILVWVMMTRAIFLFAISILFVSKPLSCRGFNRLFFRLLSLVFFLGSVNAFNRACERSLSIINHTGRLPAASLLLTEGIFLAGILALAIAMGYNYYKYQAYMKVKSLHEGAPRFSRRKSDLEVIDHYCFYHISKQCLLDDNND